MTESKTTTICTEDFDNIIFGLRCIRDGRFLGAEEAAKNNLWHEYAARLQQIAPDTLKMVNANV